jgi:dTDP-4-amino-4,6-dideoxygalactose transaminase
MQIPFVDLKNQYTDISDSIKKDINKIIDRCSFVYDKEFNEAFELKLCNYIGVNHARGCSSGTAALHLALYALGIGNGDEVILPSNSFIATALAVSYVGATPVFVDTMPNGLIDCKAILDAITPNTKAVIPVHLYGITVDVSKLRMLLPDGIYIVEDAAQALGGLCNSEGCGSVGDVAAFSFYPAKNLGSCGQAGAVVTNNKDLIDKIDSLINVGRGSSHYDFVYKGFNYRLDAIKAAFLNRAIEKLPTWILNRNIAASKYTYLLEDNNNITTMHYSHNVMSTYHLYIIELPNKEIRDMLMEHLDAAGVSTGIHYPVPIHKTEAYKEYNNLRLPVCERRSSCILSLPMFPTITDEQIEYVCSTITKFLQ